MQPIHPAQCRRLVLLGAPGVGKGTQAALLSATFGACHLSTGDIFRQAQVRDCLTLSPALREAVRRTEAGRLVDDQTILQLIVERAECLTCYGGFVLDGFPRTVPQAAALDVLLAQRDTRLDAVIHYRLNESALIERVAGRRICPVCHAVFHAVTRPPREAEICDDCGSPLIVRSDDAHTVVRTRHEAYLANTACLRDYYSAQDLLVDIDASGTPEEVFARTIVALNERDASRSAAGSAAGPTATAHFLSTLNFPAPANSSTVKPAR